MDGDTSRPCLPETREAASPIGRATLDRDLRFVEVSPALALLDGVPVAEHLGRALAEVLPAHAPALEPPLRQVVWTGAPAEQVPLSFGPPASPASGAGWLADAFPVRAGAGAVLGVELVVYPREGPRPVPPGPPHLGRPYEQTLFDQAPIGVLIADTAGRLLDANPAFCQLTGYTCDELLRMSPDDLTHPDDLAADQTLAARVLDGQQPTSASVKRYRRKDGQVIWVQITRSFVRDDAGNTRFGLAFVEDITERTRAVEALRRSEATFAAAFNNGPVILSITRLADGRIVEVNERFLTATGYSRDEVIGRTPLELGLWVRPQQRDDGLQHLRQGFALREGEADFRMKDGSVRTCLLFATVLDVNGERSVLTALTDITERRRAEAERARLAEENARLFADEQRARAEAEAAVRLRDEFLSVASHELKTPLTALLGNAQILQRRAAREGLLAERDRRSLDAIVEQIQRLSLMMAELLDVTQIAARRIALERRPLDLAELARRVVEELRPTLVAHPLVLELPATPAHLVGDELRLAQVMTNLLQNAAKYSPPGRQVMLRVATDPHEVRLAVADQGIGIPQAALPRLFERYYRAPNAGEAGIAGMGIGLYVVREIVELHGGLVSVVSVEGQGSTFTVTLPRSPEG
ncbi:MAG TPA: PAS domain S-box protein [Chloroflexaceae bacterium]|nr:PAS domain S-box protein [Chloroflexaceae bacterium]